MKDGPDPMRSRPSTEQTRMGTRSPGWRIAIRTLIVVALLLVVHDAMMTSVSANGATPTSDLTHVVVPSMLPMTTDSPVEPIGDDTIGDYTIAHDPEPMHEASDCSVIREASMPVSQSPTAPDIAQEGTAYTPDAAFNSPGVTQIRSDARAPTMDPRTQRALIQIFRV